MIQTFQAWSKHSKTELPEPINTCTHFAWGLSRILTTITPDMAPDTPEGEVHSAIAATAKIFEDSNESSQTVDRYTYDDSSPASPEGPNERSETEPGLETPSPRKNRSEKQRPRPENGKNNTREEAIQQRARSSIREKKDFDRVVERERSEIYDDLAYASVGVPRLHKQWEHKYFKILVCGESGLGRSPLVPLNPNPNP